MALRGNAVTAHQTPVVAWPRTVKRLASWALNLGFMDCVLGMRPLKCFLSIHPSIHDFEFLREVRGGGGGDGGVGGGQKTTLPFFGSKLMKLFVFFDFERKSVSGSPLHGVCMGRSGTSADPGGGGGLRGS